MFKKISLLLFTTSLINCGGVQKAEQEDQTSYTADEEICDCFQKEHEIIGINFYKEINAYKEYIAKISSIKENNFTASLLSNYEEMENKSFEIRPADTVFQKSYLESIDVDLVKKCIAIQAENKDVAKMIQRLDNVGLSVTYTEKEQLAILKSFEKELYTSSKITWVEPLELNAFFYMYDRYNKAASEINIEVFHDDELLTPPPPPPLPTQVIQPTKDEIEVEKTN